MPLWNYITDQDQVLVTEQLPYDEYQSRWLEVAIKENFTKLSNNSSDADMFTFLTTENFLNAQENDKYIDVSFTSFSTIISQFGGFMNGVKVLFLLILGPMMYRLFMNDLARKIILHKIPLDG